MMLIREEKPSRFGVCFLCVCSAAERRALMQGRVRGVRCVRSVINGFRFYVILIRAYPVSLKVSASVHLCKQSFLLEDYEHIQRKLDSNQQIIFGLIQLIYNVIANVHKKVRKYFVAAQFQHVKKQVCLPCPNLPKIQNLVSGQRFKTSAVRF